MLLFGRFAGLATAVLRLWLFWLGDDLLLFSLSTMDTTETAHSVTILIRCVVLVDIPIAASFHSHCNFLVGINSKQENVVSSQIGFSSTFVLRQWSFCGPERSGKVATADCTTAGIGVTGTHLDARSVVQCLFDG